MKEALYAIKKNKAGYDFAKVWDHGKKDVFVKLLAEGGHKKYNMYCGPVNKRDKLLEQCIAPIAPMCLVEWNE